MKLLSKIEAETSVKRDNDFLIEKNIRLRRYWGEFLKRLNSVKQDYGPEKLKKLEEFEGFCREINAKRSKLLKELSDLEKIISDRKEFIYGLIEKQDTLDEKVQTIKEREKKIELRELFVGELENKIKEQNVIVHGA